MRHSIGTKEQARFFAVERADPGFRLATADRAAHTEEEMAAVGQKLRREVPSLSAGSINLRDALAGVRSADLYAPQTLIARPGREDDGVVAVPAAAAEIPWRIRDGLRRAAGGIHHFQFPAREERESDCPVTRTVPARRRSRQRMRARLGERPRPDLLPAIC